MARYKLTKTEESQGDKHFYRIECIDEWDFTLVSWDYEKIEKLEWQLHIAEIKIKNLSLCGKH